MSYIRKRIGGRKQNKRSMNKIILVCRVRVEIDQQKICMIEYHRISIRMMKLRV